MAQTGMRDIRRRIKSIRSTMQITRGMELVASAKLTRARKVFEAAAPYSRTMEEAFNDIAAKGSYKYPLLDRRGVKSALCIVITSDRGLCGGYNVNLLREVDARFDGLEKPSLIVTGIRGMEHLRSEGCSIVKEYPGISDNPQPVHAAEIAGTALALLEDKTVDSIYLAYTKFVSALSHIPAVLQLLPPDQEKRAVQSAGQRKVDPQDILTFEPSRSQVLDAIIPMYLQGVIYGALVEAAASEQAARRLAMESATDNAQSMIEDLTLSYNRARQELITGEITEIIGGAEALQ